MTSDRPYRRALSLDHALEEIRAGSGTQFDPEVVCAFLELIDDHDLLADGRRAVPPQPVLRAV